jgi:hypothetical protein
MTMARLIAASCSALLVFACAVSSPEERPAESGGGEEAEPAAFRLRREHASLGHYEQNFSVWVSANGGSFAFGIEASSTCEVSVREAGGFTSVARFSPLVMYEGDREMDTLPAAMQGLERVRVQVSVDAQNRVIEGPTPSSNGGPSTFVLEELVEVFRHLRVVFPDEPVRIGERWSGSFVRWDTEPLAPIVLEWDPSFELEGVQDGIARVRWSAELHVLPFSAMGLSLEGQGSVEGVSLVDLGDGFTGRTELELRVGLRPAGGGVAPITLYAKYVEEVRPLP